MLGIQLNELDEKILSEIKNGKKEFLYDRNKPNSSNGEIEAIWLLRSFGLINAEDSISEQEIGFVNVCLKEKV